MDILNEAAASALPDQAPTTPDPDVEAAIEQQMQAEQEVPVPPIRSLEAAQALSEVAGGEPFVTDDDTVIQAFKDRDGRTMLIVATSEGLAKTAKA